MQVRTKQRSRTKRLPTDLILETQIYCFLQRKKGVKLKDIASKIGRKHSNVIYHIKQIEFMLKVYPDVRETLANFSEEKFLQRINEALKSEKKLQDRIIKGIMQINRNVGIFNITFDTTKKDLEAQKNYNIMGFLCNALIPVVDELKDTTEYKQSLKSACNNVLREAEKVNLIHYNKYENYGFVQNEGKEVHSLNIHNMTSNAYELALKMIVERAPSEIVSIMQLITAAEENGLKLSDVLIEFVPAKI